MVRLDSVLSLLLVGWVIAGCDSTVTPAGGGGSGGGTEVGGGGGELGGGGGTGGECVCPSAALSYGITDPEGLEVGGGVELEGSIRATTPGVWEIDTCPPNADCVASIYQLRVTIPGLTPELPEGAFVSLTSTFNDLEGILLTEWIEVRNLPSWGGESNPVSSGQELLLFANLGLDDGAPLPITPIPHCTEPGADPNGIDSFRVLDLQAQADNGPDGGPFTVEAGQVQQLSYVAGVDAGDYLVANVSVCDGYEWDALQYAIARLPAANP